MLAGLASPVVSLSDDSRPPSLSTPRPPTPSTAVVEVCSCCMNIQMKEGGKERASALASEPCPVSLTGHLCLLTGRKLLRVQKSRSVIVIRGLEEVVLGGNQHPGGGMMCIWGARFSRLHIFHSSQQPHAGLGAWRSPGRSQAPLCWNRMDAWVRLPNLEPGAGREPQNPCSAWPWG